MAFYLTLIAILLVAARFKRLGIALFTVALGKFIGGIFYMEVIEMAACLVLIILAVLIIRYEARTMNRACPPMKHRHRRKHRRHGSASVERTEAARSA